MFSWEQRKLGNLYKRVNERNDGTLGRDKWISVAKMYFQDPDKVQSNNLDTRTYVMKKGDIAFEGHPNNEFKFGRFVLNDIGTGIISELFPIYRPITEYDLDFWKYAIQLERVMAPIFAKSITSSGNSSNKLDHNHFLNQELLVPNIDEQKKIGTLLSILSKNITLHQCKLEKLKLTKKALLQKLFPKNGKHIPEIRFKGFTDAWEQRKLGEFVKIVSGDAPSTFISGNCIYVKVDDLNYSDRIQLSSSNLVNANPKAHLVNQGATIFPKRGAAIMTNKVRIMGQDGYLDTNMMALIPEEIDKDFLFTFIQKTGLYKIADTSTIPQINNKHIEPYMIQVPSEKEQAYIGVVFEKIDKIITLHQRKLERLQEVKKGLLQKMFV